jgi:hypothetical protein
MKNEKFRKANLINIIKYKVLWFLVILEDLVEEVKELFWRDAE